MGRDGSAGNIDVNDANKTKGVTEKSCKSKTKVGRFCRATAKT